MVKKEIAIMKDLRHKNIVQYINDFRDKGEWYIVLEYCGKGDMEQFKKKVGTPLGTQARYPSSTASSS